MRQWIDLFEAKVSFRKEIISAIARCRTHFGEDHLTGGNCGVFALALAKWISEKFALNVEIAAVVIGFSDDPKPLNLDTYAVGREIYHVYCYLPDYDLFYDGQGFANHNSVKRCMDAAWSDLDFDDEEDDDPATPLGATIAFGDLDNKTIMVVDGGTDRSESWETFYNYIKTL